jgi:hypothetical protein
MGCTQIMVVKIFWDWATYWSVPSLLFTNGAFTDIKMLKELFSTATGLGRKFGALNRRMQDLFLEWRPYDTEVFSNRYIDPFDLKILREFQQGIDLKHEGTLIDKIARNMELLEKFAAEIFRHVSSQVKDTPLDIKVDPYTITLDLENKMDGTEPANGIGVDPEITKDVEAMWFYKKKQFA